MIHCSRANGLLGLRAGPQKKRLFSSIRNDLTGTGTGKPFGKRNFRIDLKQQLKKKGYNGQKRFESA
jgi:hypothetical protein